MDSGPKGRGHFVLAYAAMNGRSSTLNRCGGGAAWPLFHEDLVERVFVDEVVEERLFRAVPKKRKYPPFRACGALELAIHN